MKRRTGHKLPKTKLEITQVARQTLPVILFGVLGVAPLIEGNRALADDAPATPPITTPPTTTPNSMSPADAKAQAIQAYNAGLEAVRKNDWVAAASNFEKAVTLDPKDTSSFMFLGFVRLRQEKFDEALNALQTAEKMISPADTAGKSHAL